MRYLLIMLAIVDVQLGRSQEIRLQGTVIDGETQESLLGVHILTNIKNGTVSDLDGNFNLRVQFGDTVNFSMLGYDSIALMVTDTAKYQSLFVSLKELAIELNEVEVIDFYQSNTILKIPEKEIYRVPGVYYPNIDKEGKYLYLGSVFQPFSAALTMNRKDYKQHRKLFKEYPSVYQYQKNYALAKEHFFEALEILDENFDEYYMVDFFNFTGLTVKGVAQRSAYELVKFLPEALERYHLHRKEKTPSDKSNGASNK